MLGVLGLGGTNTIGTIGASVATGGLGYLGVKDTNATNQAIATARNEFEAEEALKAREFSSDQATILRRWQENMSNTAAQRRMADLKKGGLNPLLAGKFDASTPAGGMPATAKANAHGYTAQNKIQAGLDNLATAINVKKLFHDAQKAEHEAKFSKNKATISTPMSEIAKDADSGWKTIKSMAREAGETAARAKVNIDSTINEYSHKLKTYRANREKQRTGMGVKLGNESDYTWFPDALRR